MLTSKVTTKIELPHEPGQWIEVKQPSIRDAIDVAQAEGDSWLPLLKQCIISWSYEEPVTPENIADLDTDTAWLIIDALNVPSKPGQRKNASRRSTKP